MAPPRRDMRIMYPSLRVEISEGKIQRMGNVPPVGVGPASMKPLNLQIHRGMSPDHTAKGDRLPRICGAIRDWCVPAKKWSASIHAPRSRVDKRQGYVQSLVPRSPRPLVLADATAVTHRRCFGEMLVLHLFLHFLQDF